MSHVSLRVYAEPRSHSQCSTVEVERNHWTVGDPFGHVYSGSGGEYDPNHTDATQSPSKKTLTLRAVLLRSMTGYNVGSKFFDVCKAKGRLCALGRPDGPVGKQSEQHDNPRAAAVWWG